MTFFSIFLLKLSSSICIGLAMSRSIGDYAVKSVGVIPDPETFRFEMEEKDKFMILGIFIFICGSLCCNLCIYMYMDG
jgi:hypothetical protein